MTRSMRRFLKIICVCALGAVVTGCQTSRSRVSVDYYQIEGASTADLDRDIRRKGPVIGDGKHAVAVARIKIIPNVAFKQAKRGCSVSRAKVAVDAKVTLPQWQGRASADKKLGQAWDNVDRYTRMHEAVHVAMAFNYAKRMEQELRALPPLPTCSDARQKATALVQRLLEEHDSQQKEFDAKEQRRFSMLAKRPRA